MCEIVYNRENIKFKAIAIRVNELRNHARRGYITGGIINDQ